MENETKKNFFEYSVRVIGVFGRNRKPKGHSIELLDSETKLSTTDLVAKVTQALLDIKAKPGCKWQLVETPVEVGTVSRDGKTVEISRAFMVFSGIVLAAGVV